MINKLKQNSGFLLIDILVAVTFLGIIIITLFSTIAFLLQRNKQTQNTITANLLVQEGIEIAYNEFANNWNAYSSGSYIKGFNGRKYILSSGSNEIVEAKYTRTIIVEDVKRSTTDGKQITSGKIDEKSKKITSKVTWEENGREFIQQASLLIYSFSQ